jgi:AcrR family transcriptional regulator
LGGPGEATRIDVDLETGPQDVARSAPGAPRSLDVDVGTGREERRVPRAATTPAAHARGGRNVVRIADGDDGVERRRSRKGVETRARLIEAAKVVFERDGFLDARIADISAAAGLSHGSFYHYFDSKEQVFREVADAQEKRLTAPPADGRPGSSADLSPRDRVRRANRLYLERYRAEARLMGVIEQVSRYDRTVNAARMATQRHYAERAERAIRRYQHEGVADTALDPAVAADALGAMVARFAELWLVQGYREYDFDDAVEQLTTLWANAIGLRDRPEPTGRGGGRGGRRTRTGTGTGNGAPPRRR